VSALELLDPASPVSVAQVDADQLGALSHELAAEHGARLADLFGDELEDGTVVVRVLYALDRERRYLILESALDGESSTRLLSSRSASSTSSSACGRQAARA